MACLSFRPPHHDLSPRQPKNYLHMKPAGLIFSALILAAGASRRMGRDKAWLPVEGQSLLQRQVALVRAVGGREIFISGRPDTDYSALGCPMLQDAFPDAGPLAGIERGLTAATTPLLLVLAVDLPRMDAATLEDLLSLCSCDAGVVPRISGETEPLVAIYPRKAHPLATEQLTTGHNAVRTFAQRCEAQGLVQFIDLPPDVAPAFTNWNRPDDF